MDPSDAFFQGFVEGLEKIGAEGRSQGLLARARASLGRLTRMGEKEGKVLRGAGKPAAGAKMWGRRAAMVGVPAAGIGLVAALSRLRKRKEEKK